MYLDRRKIYSYNASLNFIVLKRGYGKSYTFKTSIIDDFLKDGQQAIWLRRYKNETSKTKDKFLNDIVEKYKDHKLEIKNNTLYVDNKQCCEFITLSTCQSLKSCSYPKVTKLVFDEFLIENGNIRYLQNECDVFCGFLSTVFRDRPIKAYLLGNKTALVNPYNIYFNLCEFDRIKYISERKTLVYAKDNDDVIENNYAVSDLEKVLKGTNYYDYNFKNRSLSDTTSFIMKRDKSLQPIFIINIDGIDVGVFYIGLNKFCCDTHCDKTIKNKVTWSTDNMRENYTLLDKREPYVKVLSTAIKKGRLFYNDIKTKTIMQPILKYLA